MAQSVWKRIFTVMGMLLFLPLFFLPSAYAEQRQVEGNGMYLMGDSNIENVAVAKERAKQEAMRNAGEQAAVFVESASVVNMGQLTSDEIRTYTTSVLRIVGTPQISMTPDGNGILFRCHLVALVDTDDFKDISPESLRESKRLAEENARLSREMDELKQRYANAATEAEKQEIRIQVEQNSAHFMTVQDEEAATRFFNEGYNYDRKDQYAAAVQSYLKAIHFNPGYSYAYNNLGVIYHKILKDYDKAMECYQKAIQVNPAYGIAHTNLGIIYHYILKDYDKAIECYQKAIQIDPQDKKACNNLGHVYLNNFKDYEKAVEYYQKVIRIDPQDSDVYNDIGNAYSNLKDFDKAVECYQKAIRIKPAHAMAHRNLARVYYNHFKDYDKAVEYYQKSLRIDPQNTLAYNQLGNAYMALEDYDNALKCYQKLLQIDSQGRLAAFAYANLGDLYGNDAYENKDYAKAVEYYSKAIAINPENFPLEKAYKNRGQAYEKMGDPAMALQDIRKAMELAPDDSDIREEYERLMEK